MEFTSLFIKINPKRIAYLKFILEGYDGLAVLTTIDNHEGLLRLLTPIQRYRELCLLLGEITSLHSVDHAHV